MRPIAAADVAAIAQTDATVFGADRSSVFNHLVRVSPGGAWQVPEAGYVFGRPGVHFYQVGPLVAFEETAVAGLLEAGLRGAANSAGATRAGQAADTAAGQAGNTAAGEAADTAAGAGAIPAGNGVPPVAIDIVGTNETIRRLVQEAGFEMQRPFTRMTRGTAPTERAGFIAAVAGPEFG